MYSRTLGISGENRGGENFNRSLREQYLKRAKNTTPIPLKEEAKTPAVTSEEESSGSLSSLIESAESGLAGLNLNLDFDTVLIAGLILLLMTNADSPDIILLGALASILF